MCVWIRAGDFSAIRILGGPGTVREFLLVLFRPTFLSARNSCVSVFYDLLKFLKLTKVA